MKTRLALFGRLLLVTVMVGGALQLTIAPAFAGCLLSCYTWCNDNWSNLYDSLEECRDQCNINCGA